MQCQKVASAMAELSMKSVGRAVGLLTAYDEEIAERIRKEEDTVDKYGISLARICSGSLRKIFRRKMDTVCH